ncbi:glutaredoxin-C9-like [Populus alba x Populus x berolinensis]|uniref:Glutaredoxin-like family protein n=3 Tax=Populus TaxID=3689 RepID=A0A4U5PPX9_POPAL|nr:glutaredoxin-C9-like [Populus alba]KAJ6885938.1 glutaredoxin-C9-like [Populus alba x Populus x berolinensis]KAJ6893581.1 glutaredoxin-C9-like [Populus alba x Populus x berolinensis]KAJ6979167.1 glutaredoxin-C9-like [Populus alba x Populus x berolinensis]TKR99189.1 glutaredoxin-like family protein [Populus alba]
MQEAIPFRAYSPATTSGNRRLPARDHGGANTSSGHVLVVTNGHENHVQKLVLENSVIVFGKRGCCMCHVVKRLLLGLGVNPPVFEVEEQEEDDVIKELSMINSDRGGEGADQVQFPAVFVGGKLFGGLERVMATHITGELVPILKDAGALWL